MSQRYFQELHKTASAERRESARVPLRHYANTMKSEMKSKVTSHLREFLDEVFSAERSCRFFRTFLLRFAFDSNGSSDDSGYQFQSAYALAFARANYDR